MMSHQIQHYPPSIPDRMAGHTFGPFRIMTTTTDGETCTIKILEVGHALTKVESFPIRLRERGFLIKSFSPTTYRVSVLIPGNRNRLSILDVRNSESLLDEEWTSLWSQCFSSDGSLFAASWDVVHIWVYNKGYYIPWSRFRHNTSPPTHLLFSPTCSSILADFGPTLKMWYLDDPPAPVAHNPQPDIFSRSGTYLITARRGDRTATVTNLLPRTPPQFLDTGVRIDGCVITGNVILVQGDRLVTARRLTEEGLVDNGGTSPSGRIWVIPQDSTLASLGVKGQTGFIVAGSTTYANHTGTGEGLRDIRDIPGPLQFPGSLYSFQALSWSDPYYYESELYDGTSGAEWPISRATLQEGWVKDPGGRHRLWLPAEWRPGEYDIGWGWYHIIATLECKIRIGRVVIAF